MKPDVREVRAECSEHFWKVHHCPYIEHANTQCSHFEGVHAFRPLSQIVRHRLHGSCMLQHWLSEVGEHPATPLPIEELNPKATLEVCKTLRQGRCRHSDRCSRSRPG